MQSQWNKLVDLLNGAEEQKPKITEDFFIRLYKVLNDISANDADVIRIPTGNGAVACIISRWV